MRITAVTLGAAVCSGCIAPRGYPCTDSAQCRLDGQEGTCEEGVGFCSYPDADCPSNRRFEPRAGNGLAGQCVQPVEGTTGPGDSCRWGAVEVGTFHICAIDDEATVWCWGANQNGQLGIGSSADYRPEPLRAIPESPDLDVLSGIEVLSAAKHTCALGAGQLYCWGLNASGQVDWTDPETVVAAPRMLTPPLLPLVVLAGSNRTCVGAGSEAACWGDLSAPSNPFFEPSLPAALVAAAAGDAHVCMILGDDTVRCIGSNDMGQLGVPGDPPTDQLVTVDVSGAPVFIAAGDNHTCVITEAGDPNQRRVQCWGDNRMLQAGAVTDAIVPEPRDVSGEVQLGPWVDLAASAEHSCVADAAGGVWCWGSNRWGRADPSPDVPWDGSSRAVPLEIDAVDISAGEAMTCALDAAGVVSCWGCLSPWTIAMGDTNLCPEDAGELREYVCPPDP